ncbi:hypothetical protein [Bdellovibrio sp. HCB274]|uniref:hypothetical protein n=1 Tax=Bdellovibrio sp. HCB274 TaxID=3394361 RepID=UPI0039B5767B
MKKSLVVFSILGLALTACSSENHDSKGVVPPSSVSNDGQGNHSPEAPPSEEAPQNDQGLVGTVWTQKNTNENSEITIEIKFEDYVVSASSTCRTKNSLSSMEHHSRVLYSNEGKTAEVVSSINFNFGDCKAEIPQGIKFELEHDQIFAIDNGKRLLTGLKRKQ